MLINFLIVNTLTTAEKVHVIGFSLGAQVSGNAGQKFQEITGKKLGRITGV